MIDPLKLLGYRFFQNALIGGSIAALVCALIGLFIILRKESMIGDGIAHISFGGIALGLFMGINPLITALLASVVGVLLINFLRKRGIAQSDSAIAVMLSLGFSIGLILISLVGGFNVELFSYLFGSILTISQFDLMIILGLGIITLFLIIVFYKELLSITFDEEASKLMGIPVNMLESGLNILIAVTIVLSIKVVGMILVVALLVLPGLTALQLNKGFRITSMISVIVGVTSVIIGIFVSALFNIATSGVIIFTLTAFFLSAAIYRHFE
ncbi:metal ABC transporter permease [Candidatus Bathyarchaeota archaeon]|nr:metal ABC transporter permease [Candidatus Bathyarchaeota archaeon]